MVRNSAKCSRGSGWWRSAHCAAFFQQPRQRLPRRQRLGQRAALDGHRGGQFAAVAAGHRQRHRNAPLAQRRQHAAVALGQAAGAELQPAQAVVLVRVGAGQVEGQAGRRVAVAGPGRGQRAVQRLEVVRVGAAVGQFDVQVAGLLAEREVLRAVQRQREHGRVVAEDRRRAVALVHVEVDHQHAQQRAGARRCHSACISRAATATSLKTQ